MDNHYYMNDYVKGNKGPKASRVFFKLVIHTLIISMVVFGVPLPPVPQFLSDSIREPLQIAKNAIENVIDTSEADALIEQVSEVQYVDDSVGAPSMSTGDSGAVATIPNATNLDSTFITCGGAFSQGGGEQTIISCRQLDPTSILHFKGSGKAGAGDVWWQAVDFGQGVTVQKGAAAMVPTVGSQTIILVTPVDQDKSFTLVSRLMGGQNVTIDGSKVSAILQTPVSGQWTEIKVERANTIGSLVAEWQVVTFDASTNVNVQHNTFSFTGTSTTATPTSVVTSKSFVVVTARGTDNYVTAVLTNSTTLTFTRNAATGTAIGQWFLVEMPDGVSVQRGSTTFNSGTELTVTSGTTPSISTVAENESFTIYSTMGTATTPEVVEVGVELLDNAGSTELHLHRNTAGTATVAWQVITMPALRVTRPNVLEVWTVDDTENITWTGASTMANVQIDYKIGAGSWTPIDETASGSIEGTGAPDDDGEVTNDGFYAWKIPDDISADTANVILRISDPAAVARNDESDVGFEIQGSVDLTQPDGFEAWLIADTNQIKWTYTGSIGNVKLVYSNDSGGTYPEAAPDQTIATVPAAGEAGCTPAPCYDWYMAEALASATLKVKIYDTDDTDVVDFSGDIFAVSPNIQMLKPINTDEWPVGRTRTLEWSSNGSGSTFNLFYSSTGSGGPWTLIDSGSMPVSGYDCSGNFCYDWAIPPATTQSAVGSTKVEWGADPGVFDVGPDTGNFSVVESVSLDNPQTTVTLRALQNINIEWSDPAGAGLGPVSIWYTTTYNNPGDPPNACKNKESSDTCWTIMSTPTTASGLAVGASPYTWNVRDILGTDVGIRIDEDSNPTTVFDLDGDYDVKGLITNVNLPGEVANTIRVGAVESINWDAFGSIGEVFIYMEKDGGGYNVTIVDSTASTPTMWKDPGCVAVSIDASVETFDWGGASYFNENTCTGGNEIWPSGIPDEQCAVCTIKVQKTDESDPTTGAAGVSNTFILKGSISNVVLNPTTVPIDTVTTITWDATPVAWATPVTLENFDSFPDFIRHRKPIIYTGKIRFIIHNLLSGRPGAI